MPYTSISAAFSFSSPLLFLFHLPLLFFISTYSCSLIETEYNYCQYCDYYIWRGKEYYLVEWHLFYDTNVFNVNSRNMIFILQVVSFPYNLISSKNKSLPYTIIRIMFDMKGNNLVVMIMVWMLIVMWSVVMVMMVW